MTERLKNVLEAVTDEQRQLMAEARDLLAASDAQDADALEGRELVRWNELESEIADHQHRRDGIIAEQRRIESADRARARDPHEAIFDAGGNGLALMDLMDREERAFIEGTTTSIDLNLEKRDLTVGTATDGAELVTASLHRSLAVHLVEETPMMELANIVRTETGEDLLVPQTSSFSAAAIVTEGSTISESDPQFTQVTIASYRYAHLTQISSELIQDAGIDIVSFLTHNFARAIAAGVGPHFATGTGSGQPQGLFAGATTGVTAAGTTTVTADEIQDLFHSVLPPYRKNASWIMSDATFAAISQLKDGDGQYLIGNLSSGADSMLMGRPVVIDVNAPAMTTGLDAIAFGDIDQAYMIRLAGPVRIERSDDFAFANDLVTFRVVTRLGAAVIDATAYKVLTMT